MKLDTLIKSYNWLSIELTILDLYPDQQEFIELYQEVFESLKLCEAVDDEMCIVLTYYDNEDGDGDAAWYVDVSGRKELDGIDSISDSYALEFIRWEAWLGMTIEKETINSFSEQEIIAHCLYEMTFCGFDQEEIQQQLLSIKNRVEDYKKQKGDDNKSPFHLN